MNRASDFKLLRQLFVLAAVVPSFVFAEPQAVPQADIYALVAAVEANGCTISRDNAAAVIAASGLEPDAAQAAMDALGEASENPDLAVRLVMNEDRSVATLISGACPAE